MAVQLFLNDTQVFPDGKQAIKLTRENPYFMQSDSYTLDVTLPMGIVKNRTFFKNINRLERNKKVQRLSCKLVVDNELLLDGSATVTQVTEQDVKVQLLGGRSEVNFLSKESKIYIDEMDLGSVSYTSREGGNEDVNGSFGGKATGGTIAADSGIRLAHVQVMNETLGTVRNPRSLASAYCAPQPLLLDVLGEVVRLSGFQLIQVDVDREPWTSLYVASAKCTRLVAHTLPHWLVSDFISEVCRFFNCTMVIDQATRTARMVANATYFGNGRQSAIEPVDEYTVEMDADEAHSLATDTLSFDLSASEHHDYDVIPDNVRQMAERKEYATITELVDDYNAMTETERRQVIMTCPKGSFAEWLHDGTETGWTGDLAELTQIDVLAPLDRGGDSGTQFKIVPVAIFDGKPDDRTDWFRMPSLEVPTGDDPQRMGGSRTGSDNEETPPSIQEYVMGEADIENAEKEDRLQVMFVDDVPQTYTIETSSGTTEAKALMGFTDCRYKASRKGNGHRLWSLALNPTDATYYLGQLHQNGFSFNMQARHTFRFIAQQMPDPTRIYIIRGKRYACEKVEAQIDSQGIQQLMTGYFYEMLEPAQKT